MGDKLPSRVPQHPACDNAGALIEDLQDGDSSMTVFFNGCPGADVTVERVVQLTSNRLLWVQVRSEDRATANRVLASVTTTGDLTGSPDRASAPSRPSRRRPAPPGRPCRRRPPCGR